MKKHIVIYVDSMMPPGGKERVVANLLGRWVDDYKITLLTKDQGKSFYNLPNTIEVKSIDCALKLDMNNRFKRVIEVFFNMFKSIICLKKILEEINYDYIYTTTPLNSYEIYWAIGKKKCKKNLVVSEHASYYAFNNIYNYMKKKVYPDAFVVSVPNKMDVELYKEWGSNSVYIPHVIPKKNVKPNELDTKILLNVGRLTSDKRQFELINSWGEIKNHNGWKLWIVGDGEEREKLLNLIRRKGIKDVLLFPATREIEKYYKKASFFAFSSRMEGFGMVLLEAMQFGVPCISFDCPSGPRDIVNEMNGFLIKNNDWARYTKIIEEVLFLTQEELNEYGEAAYSTVEQWDNDIIIDEWNKIFK